MYSRVSHGLRHDINRDIVVIGVDKLHVLLYKVEFVESKDFHVVHHVVQVQFLKA